jgi:hypothetical protein
LPARRVRIVRASDEGRPAWQAPERSPAPPRPPRPRGAYAYGPPQSDLGAYVIGGLVSAAVALLLIVVWIVAVPNNPLTGNNNVPAPAVNNNSNANTNPFDVPTDANPIQADGTSYPTIPPALPTGSPGPAGDSYLPDALGVLHAGSVTGHELSVSAHGLRHLRTGSFVATIE